MNWVNAAVQFSAVASLFGPGFFVDSVNCVKRDDGRYSVDAFDIFLFLSFRSCLHDNENNPLNQRKKLDFKLRLSCDDGHMDVTEFGVDLSDESRRDRFMVGDAECECVNLIESVAVRHLTVDAPGDYVIKVLVHEHGDELWNVQSAKHLLICRRK